MGIASMVIGIVSIVLGFIPICGMIAFWPALVGLVLGIVDAVLKTKKQQPKGMAVAGISTCAVALVVIAFWVLVIAAGAAAEQ